MKDLAIIGASYLQLPLIKKAKQLGYTTHVFAWKANDVGEYEADHFYPISIVEKEEILQKCQEIGIVGICSIASDLATVTVNYVADKMGLPGNSLECTKKSTNKYEMRQTFSKNGDPSPKSIEVDLNTDLDDLKITFPVIVKPTDRSGSRGIFKIESRKGLKPAIEKSIEQSFEKKALVEEYAEGQEYSVEYITFKGKHHFLAITLKKTTGAPHFIETGHLEPAPLSEELQSKVKKVVEHALDSLMVENSASHSEIKIDEDGNIKIIEIGARMGGDCIGSDLVQLSTGVDFVKAVIDVAIGIEPEINMSTKKKSVEVRFIFTEDDLTELNRLKENEPERLIRIVDLHPENIGSITDSSNRAGCYIVWAK